MRFTNLHPFAIVFQVCMCRCNLPMENEKFLINENVCWEISAEISSPAVTLYNLFWSNFRHNHLLSSENEGLLRD